MGWLCLMYLCKAFHMEKKAFTTAFLWVNMLFTASVWTAWSTNCLKNTYTHSPILIVASSDMYMYISELLIHLWGTEVPHFVVFCVLSVSSFYMIQVLTLSEKRIFFFQFRLFNKGIVIRTAWVKFFFTIQANWVKKIFTTEKKSGKRVFQFQQTGKTTFLQIRQTVSPYKQQIMKLFQVLWFPLSSVLNFQTDVFYDLVPLIVESNNQQLTRDTNVINI